MFGINDVVLYSTRGVCIIKEYVTMPNGENGYKLQNVNDSKISLIVPETATEKMRKVLTKDEIDKIITGMADKEMPWIENEKERLQNFRQILASGDREQIMLMIKLLYCRRLQLKKRNKKLHVADEQMFKTAEDLLHNEFSYALKIKKEEIAEYIGRRCR